MRPWLQGGVGAPLRRHRGPDGPVGAQLAQRGGCPGAALLDGRPWASGSLAGEQCLLPHPA